MASKKPITADFKSDKRKPFSNLPLTSPWRSRAPFFKPNILNRKIPGRNLFISPPIKNKSPKITIVTDNVSNIQCKKPLQQKPPEKTFVTTDESNGRSSQFQYFMRLMQLFPLIHPAYIHSVFTHCNNNFLKTIDTLLRARPTRMAGPVQRKFGPSVQFFQKMPAPMAFVPRVPVVQVNGFNGMGNNMNSSQLYRNFSNFRFQFPQILPKTSMKNLHYERNVQCDNNVIDNNGPVIKIEAKGQFGSNI